ncbi:MAG: aminotransferase class I/II-fold pyridoxal phosphate-dependent enzyme [Pseudohongiella sp.]|nr:aminotransferase class I/II-fold pyridoxal phosphate-dependent enzyme [Pseudohongiella sp.]
MTDFRLKPADRTRLVNPFRVMNVLERARQLERMGRDIVHLEVGEPDFATAAPIAEAGMQAIKAGHTAYTPAAGLPALRERISQFYCEHHGVNVDPRRILVTPGASGALVLLANLLLNTGDAVLMPDPSYPCNRNFVHLAGARAVLVPPEKPGDAAPSIKQLNQLMDASVRGLWLASPANPTGAVIAHDHLARLVQWAQQSRVHLMVDEIYQGLDYVLGARASRAMGNLPTALTLGGDTIVVNSFSKYFGMTGWRVGWIVVPEYLVETANILAQNLFISAPTISQLAAIRAFDPDVVEILEQRRDAYRQRRDYLAMSLKSLGLILPWDPQGAFYCYADVSRFSDDCEAFCHQLLEQHGIAATPGTDFGEHHASRYVRFAFTSSLQNLEKAIGRLSRALV